VDTEIRESGHRVAEAHDDQRLSREAHRKRPIRQLSALANGHPRGAKGLVEGRLTSGIEIVGARLARERRLVEAAHC
jgi:hypothetical protein